MLATARWGLAFATALGLSSNLFADEEVPVDPPMKALPNAAVPHKAAAASHDGGTWATNPGCQPDCCCDKGLHWYLTADAIVMKRYSGSGAELFDNLTARAFNFDWEVGPRVTAGVWLNRCLAFEGTFWSINAFNDSVGAPIDPVDPTAGAVQFNYRSRLYNGEGNFRYKLSDSVAVLAGFRYLNLNEAFDIAVTGPLGAGSVNARTDNNLYGGQIGLDFNVPVSERLRLGVLGKAGIYYNDVGGNITASALGVPIAQATAQADQTAFIGEVNVGASYKLGKHVAVRGGYQALWLEGVALIPDQGSSLRAPAGSSLNTNGGLFMHGFFGGLELKW